MEGGKRRGVVLATARGVVHVEEGPWYKGLCSDYHRWHLARCAQLLASHLSRVHL